MKLNAQVPFSAQSEVALTYHQRTAAERYTLRVRQVQGCCPAALARNRARSSGYSRPELAERYARGRRSHSRRNTHLTAADWRCIDAWLCADWSPEQIAGWCARHRLLAISHETIDRHVWQDKANGGALYTHLRGARKQLRKRYGAYDSRGRLAGKRPIATRPVGAANRSRYGHWERDTVLGDSQGGACILTLVERKSGYTVIGRLTRRTGHYVNARAKQLITRRPRPMRPITVENGTEFHADKTFEAQVSAQFYFATPHHAWERGTNKKTNGLICQYLPKRMRMEHLPQAACTRIATKLNRRPRKRLGYRTPEECYAP